jgi:hypothetical protein
VRHFGGVSPHRRILQATTVRVICLSSTQIISAWAVSYLTLQHHKELSVQATRRFLLTRSILFWGSELRLIIKIDKILIKGVLVNEMIARDSCR